MQNISFHPAKDNAYISIKKGELEVGQIRYNRDEVTTAIKSLAVHDNQLDQEVNTVPIKTVNDAKAFAEFYYKKNS